MGFELNGFHFLFVFRELGTEFFSPFPNGFGKNLSIPEIKLFGSFDLSEALSQFAGLQTIQLLGTVGKIS